MATIRPNFFNINGVVSTDKTVMQNINDICTAAAAWMTFDINQGRWSVIINQSGSSISSFTDSNIIGGINVSGNGINEVYNSVTIEFPHKDLRDVTDFITVSIPQENRLPNELDNQLIIRTDLINDPIQAEYIATVELKQSRIDKIIQFRTDFSKIGLKAGDLIDITSDVYGYTNKMFRIITINEEDSDDGNILLSITAQEYVEDIYDSTGLVREVRSKSTGIIPISTNTAIQGSNAASVANDLTTSFNDPTNALLIASLLAAIASKIGSGGGTMVALDTFVIGATQSTVDTAFNGFQGTPSFPWDGESGVDLNFVLYIPFTVGSTIEQLVLQVQTALAFMDYESDNGTRNDFYAYVPCQWGIFKIDSLGQRILLGQYTSDWQANTLTITLANATPGNYEIGVYPIPTYDLNQSTTNVIGMRNFRSQVQPSGGAITITGYSWYR